jgi:plasmid stability protein
MESTLKRATVYFDPELHRALRIKAAETERSMSDLVNEAVQLSLVEDSEDLAAFEDRVNEPSLSYEDVVKDLKRRGKILNFGQTFCGERNRSNSAKERTAARYPANWSAG